MQTVLFETSLGVVPVWGRFDIFDSARPALLVIRGSFPEADNLLGLAEALPHVDIAFVHLPGMHSPPIANPSIPRFAGAFDEVVPQVFGARALNVLGISVGGLAAFGLRHPTLRSIIAVDTPLSTGGLWPLRPHLQLQAATSEFAEWLWNVFGVAPDRIENRDYAPLLATLQTTVRVLVGDIPLAPERPLDRLPSLVSEADRAVYRSHPAVGTTTVGGAGHNIPRDGQVALFDRLHRWLGTPKN